MLRPMSRRALMQTAFVLGMTQKLSVAAGSERTAGGTHSPDFLAGVNLAGAEFGKRMPGRHGTDFIYPSADQIAFYRTLGFNVIRFPFRWERLQPDMMQPFDEAEWQRLDKTIRASAAAGLSIILDVHNYARRKVRKDDFQVEHLIGSKQVPASSFASFWRELGLRTKREPRVIFGLMNEPYDISAEAWMKIAGEAVRAIRSTGAENLVLVPGTAWSGAHSWVRAGNTVLAGFHDPAGNWAVDVHQYVDKDSSGRSPNAVSETIGAERLIGFQNWARQHKLRAFLGEFGSGGNPVSQAAVSNMLAEVHRNRDVWLGWSAWAAGSWWPEDYPLNLQVRPDGTLPAQMKVRSGLAKQMLTAK